MTVLNVNYTDPSDAFAPRYGDLSAAIQQALGAWTSHFDTPRGSVSLDVTFTTLPANFVALGGYNRPVRVGGTAARPVYMSGFGYEVATGATLPSVQTSGQLTLDRAWFDRTFARAGTDAGEAQRVLQHEFGHAFGLVTATSIVAGSVVAPTSYTTMYDRNLQFSSSSVSFLGPNAVAAFGGAVPVDFSSPSHDAAPNGRSIMSYTQGAYTVQPLDVAMLRDTGMPILSDIEVQEHTAARLYQAALGRAPDGPGLLNAARALLSGASTGSVASGFISSQEFSSRFGEGLSNEAFVGALYQNVLGRAGEAAGVQFWNNALVNGTSRADALLGFADSPENRNAFAVNPNLSYGATAEAQMERLYDTAFGRAPDPAGFRQWTLALINGTTLQQVAMGFMTAPEFTNRYGSAPTNQALVDAFYQNTLHRAADAAGEASWLTALNNGLSRTDLVAAFSESAEHQRNVVAQDTAASGGYLVDPSAHLGSIPVLPVVATA